MDTTTLAAAQQIDFSLLALFARASFIVKLVMLMLSVASVWSWAIIIQKFISYRKARQDASMFDRAFRMFAEAFEKRADAIYRKGG